MYPTKPNNIAQKVTAGIVVILAVVLLSIAASITSRKSSTATTSSAISSVTRSSSASASSSPTTTSNATTSTTSGYKDGTYSASASYRVPHGSEDIKVTLTVSGGVISDTSITNSEGDRESAAYQQDFESEYKTYVVGKNISGLQLSYVAGASDTTQGFDDALDQIRSDAKA